MAAGRPAWVGGTLQRDADASDEECVQDVLRREYASRGVATETLRVSSVAALSVDAYVEYCRVVGDADGGELLTDEEYAAFRAKAAERAAQRLFVHWRNAAGFDCKAVGPATLCECGHRYREHATDALPQGGRGRWQPVDLRCRAAGCACSRFTYLPSAGAWQAKCACKHGAAQHDALTKACTAPRCPCSRFFATFSCGCGQPWCEHATVVETRQQRLAAGLVVDNLGGGGDMYAALGGVTGFSSLTDGYECVQRGLLADGAPEGAAVAPSDALSRLKAARGRARGIEAVPAAAADHAHPAASHAERRRAAAEAASAAAAARRAEQQAREAEEVVQLSELDQLHRLSLKSRR